MCKLLLKHATDQGHNKAFHRTVDTCDYACHLPVASPELWFVWVTFWGISIHVICDFWTALREMQPCPVSLPYIRRVWFDFITCQQFLKMTLCLMSIFVIVIQGLCEYTKPLSMSSCHMASDYNAHDTNYWNMYRNNICVIIERVNTHLLENKGLNFSPHHYILLIHLILWVLKLGYYKKTVTLQWLLMT